MCLGDAGTVVVSTTGAHHRQQRPAAGPPWNRIAGALGALRVPALPPRCGLRVGDKGKGIYRPISRSLRPHRPAHDGQPRGVLRRVRCDSPATASWSTTGRPGCPLIPARLHFVIHGPEPVVIFGEGGAYDVTLTVTDSAGNSDSKIARHGQVGPTSHARRPACRDGPRVRGSRPRIDP